MLSWKKKDVFKTTAISSQDICLPGCNCCAKLPVDSTPMLSRHTTDDVSSPESSQVQLPTTTTAKRTSISISPSLIRLPDDIERRSSIHIAFDSVV